MLSVDKESLQTGHLIPYLKYKPHYCNASISIKLYVLQSGQVGFLSVNFSKLYDSLQKYLFGCYSWQMYKDSLKLIQNATHQKS